MQPEVMQDRNSTTEFDLIYLEPQKQSTIGEDQINE